MKFPLLTPLQCIEQNSINTMCCSSSSNDGKESSNCTREFQNSALFERPACFLCGNQSLSILFSIEEGFPKKESPFKKLEY